MKCNQEVEGSAVTNNLERDAREWLEDRFGVKLRFTRRRDGGKWVSHAK